ncbi:endolytic transglycosylase MltG [Streptomyces sp. NPDC048566]|uniref:endolytic transglycosylase MltG n=1 Tax=Streptomyces sp. NPDC048566 TaxID=3365569 RepID=UPI0037145457
MTEYGRGPGSEPWHPQDPLYGDGGWGGQAADGRSAYDGGRPQQYGQAQAHPDEQGDWGTGGQPHGQGYQQYPQHSPGESGQYPYPEQQYPGQGQPQYAGQPQQHYPAQGQQQYRQQQPGDDRSYDDGGGWQTGGHPQVPYAADPTDPYAGGYPAEQPDFYNTPEAYPPPEPPARRRAEPEPETDWDPGPDEGEHAFFSGGDEDDDADDDPQGRRGRGDRKGRGGAKGRKRRSGCACLVVVAVFGGGLAGVTYFGYHYYQNRFGSAPDYAGDGSGQVTVEIGKGAGGYEIGQKLKALGVVKSVDAFVSAQQENPDGQKIQAGAYLLRKQMSAASAVELMLDPKSQNNVVVAPGNRNVTVYAAIDKQLGLSKGTTGKVAEKDYKSLGLPSWANSDRHIKDPLEGFLWPATYPAAKGMKPENVLKSMVKQASSNYASMGIEEKAKSLKLADPLQVVTVASLVQAEGKTHDDFRKMAEVVYNRLKPSNTETNQLLQFDSTFNYLKRQSNIHISESEINSNRDPYNTYTQKGLPPGPIGNPGVEALNATFHPTSDGWMYFVATDGHSKTEFARTNADFEKLKDKFNDSSGN